MALYEGFHQESNKEKLIECEELTIQEYPKLLERISKTLIGVESLGFSNVMIVVNICVYAIFHTYVIFVNNLLMHKFFSNLNEIPMAGEKNSKFDSPFLPFSLSYLSFPLPYSSLLFRSLFHFLETITNK